MERFRPKTFASDLFPPAPRPVPASSFPTATGRHRFQFCQSGCPGHNCHFAQAGAGAICRLVFRNSPADAPAQRAMS
jgi:hypothetical protein